MLEPKTANAGNVVSGAGSLEVWHGLRAVCNLISEAERVTATAEFPLGRGTTRWNFCDLCWYFIDDLIGQTKLAPVAMTGRKGGASIAKHKMQDGGRPRKEK